MAFKQPSLQENYQQILSSMQNRLPDTDPYLKASVLDVLARSFAGSISGLYGFIDWAVSQRFIDSAETTELERMALTWGIARAAAVKAKGSVIFKGESGSVVAKGVTLQRPDGFTYSTESEVVLSDNNTAIVGVTADQAGSTGNMHPNAKLELISPVLSVDAIAIIDEGGLVLGEDAETDSSLRSRLLARIQQPPHGGAAHDYKAWALQSSAHGVAVTRAWISPSEMGAGTVTIRFMMDDNYADGIPESHDIEEVRNYIESVRPVTAEIYVVAPDPKPLEFEIAGLNPLTESVKDSIIAELKDLIRREAEVGGDILLSHIHEAISIAAGEHDHVLVSPLNNVASDVGEIITFGGVIWS